MLSRLLLLLILMIAPAAHAGIFQFADVSEKRPANLTQVLQDVEHADVIFIGEAHDDANVHKAQLDIIRSLHQKKHPLAIGLEMFTTEDQRYLNDWTEGKLDEEQFLPVYARNWSDDWQLYRGLFSYARENHIPLIALNTPKPVISKVMAQGATALQDSEIPPNMSWSLNESQTDYMRTIARQVFGNTPPEQFISRLSEAQALRNSTMAWNIAKYRNKHRTDQIVVLAGVWHAVKNGVPEILATYGPATYKVILPELPELNLRNATVKEADYLMVNR